MPLLQHHLRQVGTATAANHPYQAPPPSALCEAGARSTPRPYLTDSAASVGVERATPITRPRGAAASVGEPPDQALVARVLGGDLDAFGAILARHQDRIYSIAANFAANRDDASDLAQEVFVKAYRSLAGFRGQSAFSTWLYRIAVNTCVDYTRRQARSGWLQLQDDAVSAPTEPGLDPQHELERKELRSDLVGAIAGLSWKLRTALILHDVEGLTHEEIAAVVGCSIGTTKSRLFRAREEVRRRLRGQKEGDGT